MKMNQLKAGTLITYLQLLSGTLFSLLVTPYILDNLGQNEYGLYSTVSSTIMMLSILSLGFSSSYIRYFTRFKEDTEKLARLNGLYLILFIIIGLVALIVGGVISYNQDLIFSTGLTPEEKILSTKLMVLLTINISIGFPCSVFASIISAYERFIFIKMLTLIRVVATPVATIIILSVGFKSIGMVIITLLISLLISICNVLYAVIKLRARFIMNNFDKSLIKEIFVFTSFIAINMVVYQINMNIPKIILARYKGTSEVAIYSLAFIIYSHYSPISTAISNVFTPRIHRIIQANKDDEEKQNLILSDLFIKVGRIQFLILAIICTGFILVGQAFILRWGGVTYGNAYYVGLLLLIPAIVPLSQNLGIEIQRAKNLHKFRSIIYLIMAVINVIICIICVQMIGAIGAAVGTSISLIIANGIIINWYYNNIIGLDIKRFWINIWIMSRGFIFPMLLGLIITKFIVISGYIPILLFSCIYMFICVISLWFCSFNSYEKEQIRKIYKKFRAVLVKYFCKTKV